MHSCLSNDDVLSQIFVHFSDCNLDKRSARALATLARTCKAFSGPALSVLWRDLKTLIPLVTVGPQDLWAFQYQPWKDPSYIEGDAYWDRKGWGKQTRIVTLRKTLQEQDLERIRYYGSKIRRFDQEYDYGENVVHESVWAALARFYPTHKIFPNLRSIHLFLDLPHTAATLRYLRIFIGPQTKTVGLTLNPYWTGPEKNWDFASFSNTVSHSSPNLDTLILSLPTPNACEPISQLVCSLKRLSSITCNPAVLNQATIKHLARSRALKSWEGLELSDFVTNRSDEFFGDLIFAGLPGYAPPRKRLLMDLDYFDTQQGYFPALRKLSFHVQNWDTATEIIRKIDKPMESIKVHHRQFMSAATDMPTFTRELPRFSSSLKEVLLHGAMPGFGPMASDPALFTAALEPLASLPHLEWLLLSSPGMNLLKDDFLIKSSESWPRLRFLHIGGGSLGVRSLVALAQNCPGLETLQLDFTYRRAECDALGPIVPNFSLTRLCIGSLRHQSFQDGGIRSLFKLLIAIFPSLKDIAGSRNGGTTTQALQQLLEVHLENNI